MTSPVEPIATYRFQLTPDFGFDAVADRLDHVRRLGASHVYLSPIAQAVPESCHGYDVVDHTRVRDEFGGADGFERLLEKVAERDMAVVIDHVPNHVAAIRPELNPPWWAMLRDGPDADAARWFDVDWELTGGTVILPVLGAPLDDVVAAGQIVVDDQELVVYGERRLPLTPGSGGLDLDALLDVQHYRLQHWRDADRNVRRFFTIDDLVAVRVEDPAVAEIVDTLPAAYASHPGFGGVRVDHIDGLADPEAYLRSLRSRIGPDTLLWVEKIIVPGEWLPRTWPVDGTTGYEFMRACDQVLIAGDAQPMFDDRWREDSDDVRPFHEWELAARREVVAEALAPDLGRVRRVATRATGRDEAAIGDELTRLTTELPRYRTYLPDDEDAAALITAIADGPVAEAIMRAGDAAALELRTRWQQLTGPVMAKGAEDRSFYRYLRLASLCEVGGDPGTFGIGVDEFHADNLERQRSWPHGMLAGSTHDTKRSDDVRCRSAALTWRAARSPDEVASFLRGWIRELTGRTGVDAATASLAAQTVITAPGVDGHRLADYLVKACREAAMHTTWESPGEDYERRLAELAELAAMGEPEPVLRLDPITLGLTLASTALRLTSPGVPDVYQGTETVSYRLVDPDNRVPPDWPELDREGRDARVVSDLWLEDSPAAKAVLVRTLLELRRRRAGAFGVDGAYTVIDAGPGVIAFARGRDVVVAIRRGLAEVDRTFEFPPGSWYDVLDPAAPTLSGTVDAASVVGSGDDGTMPLAVFERD